MNSSVDLLRAVFALAFVVGLIWLLGFLIRKYGWKIGLPTTPITGKPRRLQLVETLSLDAKTRLVLIRRDEAEHLVILNAESAQLIEADIKTGNIV